MSTSWPLHPLHGEMREWAHQRTLADIWDSKEKWALHSYFLSLTWAEKKKITAMS